MATKKYGRKQGKKTRKNKRGGGGTSQKRNTMSMKNIKKTMSDIFGKEVMKAQPSRSQPSRTVKANTLAIIKAAEEALKRKQATAASNKEKKTIFKNEMNTLADKLKRVLLQTI
jgi:hypothetical protein